jgi:hypothetical protein
MVSELRSGVRGGPPASRQQESCCSFDGTPSERWGVLCPRAFGRTETLEFLRRRSCVEMTDAGLRCRRRFVRAGFIHLDSDVSKH